MKIAIIGAGFAGLATAWQLLEQNEHLSITLFDPSGIGGQASSISAGLLHTYIGLHAKYNQDGREGYEETRKLLNVASKALNQLTYAESGLLRPALSDSQQLDYRICADKYDDVEWLSADQAQRKVPCLSYHSALWIKSALTVYPELYTQGLGLASLQRGVTFEKKAIVSLAEVDNFDAIIIAAGPQTLHFPELASLRLNFIKGQILEMAWPVQLTPLTMPVNSQTYIVMNRNNKSCIIGSTYERTFTSSAPNIEVAMTEILPKAVALIPLLAEAEVLGCRAGIRVSSPGHLPIIQQISPRIWVFTGLGSKGLLYHALYAKKLVKAILK